MTPPTDSKGRIASMAVAAAAARQPIDDACPYPFGTEEATHFKAVYLTTLPAEVALPRRIPYPAANTTCPELSDAKHRAGSSAQREIPSRTGNELRYRDGTVTDLQGNLLRRRA